MLLLFLINFYKFLERLCNHIGIPALEKIQDTWVVPWSYPSLLRNRHCISFATRSKDFILLSVTSMDFASSPDRPASLPGFSHGKAPYASDAPDTSSLLSVKHLRSITALTLLCLCSISNLQTEINQILRLLEVQILNFCGFISDPSLSFCTCL